MPVTDEQVATLRAHLAGDPAAGYERWWQPLDTEAASSGYTALVFGGFVEAVDRWFAAEGTVADVVEFVDNAWSRSYRSGVELDPAVTERVIRHTRGDGSVADIDPETRRTAQAIILTALIADEQLDDEGLDEFLAQARVLGDRLMR